MANRSAQAVGSHGRARGVAAAATALVAFALLLPAVAVTPAFTSAASQAHADDDNTPAHPPTPGDPLPPAVRDWVERVRTRDPMPVVEADCIRVNLTPALDGRSVYYHRVTPRDPDPGRDGSEDDDGTNAEDGANADAPRGKPRSLLALNAADYTIARADLLGVTRDVVDCGPAAGRFYLIGDSLVCLRRLDDTDEDGAITADDAPSLWSVALDDPPTLIQIYPPTRGLTLCGLLKSTNEALVGLPTDSMFDSQIGRLPLLEPRRDGDGNPVYAAPTPLTRGVWVECIEPDDKAVIVSRVSAPIDDEDNFFAPWMNPNLQTRTGPVFVRPFDHVRVVVGGGTEQTILSGEEWHRLAFVDGTSVYFESLTIGPEAFKDEPLVSAMHTLNLFDIESRARVPIVSDMQADHQFVGQIPGRGIAYLRTTFFNRRLMLYVQEKSRHAELSKLSPFTHEFAIAPGGRSATPALFFLNVEDTNGDGRLEHWRDNSAVVLLPLN